MCVVVDDDVGCQGSDHRQCTHHAMRVFPSDGCVCGARQEVTNEEAYDAEEAGLVFDISNTSANSPCSGLRLTFKGYDDKMPKLVSTILKLIGNLDFASPENQAVFDLVKEKTMTDYRNRRFQQPYHHGMTTAASLCEHPFWDREVCAILGLVRWRWCAGSVVFEIVGCSVLLCGSSNVLVLTLRGWVCRSVWLSSRR